MATTYKTIAGDTWDVIANNVYGDDHAYEQIMDANPQYIDVFVFSGDIELTIPDEEVESSSELSTDYPAWRTELDNG